MVSALRSRRRHAILNDDADVDVASFEDKTIAEQLALIQCACALVGVQGAGLAWYRFLPRNTTLVEIHFRGWVSKYAARAARWRPDVRAHTVQCRAVTSHSTWVNFARMWYNHTGGAIDDTMKAKLIERSSQVNPVQGSGNIWKYSDVICSNMTLHDVARTLL